MLAVSTITLLAVTMSANHDEPTPELRVNKTNPLLLISLDGYRSDYFYRYQPTLKSMAENGVKAHYMMSSYPTITFPNHYSIVTVSKRRFTYITYIALHTLLKESNYYSSTAQILTLYLPDILYLYVIANNKLLFSQMLST